MPRETDGSARFSFEHSQQIYCNLIVKEMFRRTDGLIMITPTVWSQ